MSVKLDYIDTEEKLEKLCSENHLRVEFRRSQYPTVFIFEPMYEHTAQTKLDGVADDGKVIDINASMEIRYADESTIQTYGDFAIDNDVDKKIKTLTKKLYLLHLQGWWREMHERDQGRRPSDNADEEYVDIPDDAPADEQQGIEGQQMAITDGSGDDECDLLDDESGEVFYIDENDPIYVESLSDEDEDESDISYPDDVDSD